MRSRRRKQAEEPEGSEDELGRRSSLRPGDPKSWRDVVRSDYAYPDELDELGRRERRRAKQTWRRDDHARRIAWLRQQRQSEPTSPATIVAVVLILAIVVLGLGGGLPRLLGREEPTGQDVGLLTPSVGAPTVPGPVQSIETTPLETLSPTSSLSTPPVLTERPSALATAAAADVVKNWARTFYTRNPTSETYSELVARTEPFVTDEVAASLVAAGDSTYEALKSAGGRSVVASVTVTAARPDSAPVDTPTRISRLATITIEVSGNRASRIQLPLVLTLVPEGTVWVISDVNGGAGP